MNEEGGRRGGGGAEMDPWGGGCCCCGGCRWGLREDSGLHVSTKHITNGPGSSGRTEGHGGNDVWQHGGAETTDPGGTVRGDYRLCLGAGEAAPAGGSLAVRGWSLSRDTPIGLVGDEVPFFPLTRPTCCPWCCYHRQDFRVHVFAFRTAGSTPTHKREFVVRYNSLRD